MAESVDTLIVFRILQAVGGCVGMVAARAMVRDLFDTTENAKVFSMLMLVVSVSPIIAPALGGYITAAFGWRYVFVALIIVVLLILAGTFFFLPESKKPDPGFSLRPPVILKKFASVLMNPRFLTYALTGAISYAGLYAYVGGSPFVFMEMYKVTEPQFGFIFAFIAAGLISASQVNNIVLKYFSSPRIIFVASASQCLIGVLFVCFTISGFYNLYIMVGLVFLFLACQGFIFPNATALTLEPMGHNAGNASALIGAIQMGIGATASAIIGIMQNISAVPMSVVMATCSIMALTVFLLGKKYLIKDTQEKFVRQGEVEAASCFNS
jgi:DHA1 family bicyclomycin/chloramphenicol resistance-like MFS transporter